MIALFSATGNSRLVASALSPLIGGDEIKPILSLTDADIASAKRIVWVFPVHGWGIPSVVADAIGRLNLSSAGTEHFMVVTCGDDIGRTDRAFRRLMASRGASVRATFSVVMPNTYVLLPGMDTDSPDVESRKLLDAPARVEFIAKAIRHRAAINDIRPGAFPGLKSSLLRAGFKLLVSARPFKVDAGACISCGRCSAACPLDNITMTGTPARPAWGPRCITCLACYHVCPAHAISWGGQTSRKGQYRAPAALADMAKNE